RRGSRRSGLQETGPQRNRRAELHATPDVRTRKSSSGVRTIYSQRLIKEGVITEAELNALIEDRVKRYEAAQTRAKELVSQNVTPTVVITEEIDGSAIVETPVTAEIIKTVADKIALVPEGFNINPKMVGQLARR